MRGSGTLARPRMNFPVRSTSTTAIISLVSGLLAWTLIPLLGALAAIVLGHIARSEIRNAGGTMEGDGMAIAGLVLGYLQIAIVLLVIVAVVVIALLWKGG